MVRRLSLEAVPQVSCICGDMSMLPFAALAFVAYFFSTTVIYSYDYSFSENGLVAYKDGKLLGTQVRMAAEGCSLLHSGL